MTATTARNIDLTAVRTRIGRIGVWLGSPLGALPASQERDHVQQIEELGYSTLWLTEFEKEAFAHSGLVLGATRTLTVATGIANVWLREPETAALGANALAEAYDGRFVLGVGIGHARFMKRYNRPLETMRDYLDRMITADLPGPAPAEPAPWVVAALRPKMLELAATRAQGSHPYFVPPEHTALAREALGGDPVLAPEVTVVLDTDPGRARTTARAFMHMYLELPNYRNNLLALGYGESDLAGGGSDRLVDALIAWGDAGRIKRRLDEHFAGGADHVCIQPLTADGRFPLRELTELAPALLGGRP
jgi:probable F420-dependent oxidoreductase